MVFTLACSIAQASFALPRVWGSVEYLHWWTQNSSLALPLVTQNNSPSSFAIINQPGTQIIFGANSSNNDFEIHNLNGGRIVLGGWLDNSDRYGLEGTAFTFAQQKSTFTASSVPINSSAINVPFFSPNTGGENVLVAGLPNTVTDYDFFRPASYELNGLFNLNNCGLVPFILSAGFRYNAIYEKIALNDAVINIATLPSRSVLNVEDSFSAQNKFYGAQVGVRTKVIYGDFLFAANAEIAFGTNRQTLTIAGQTNVNNQFIIQSTGLFAEPSNIGTFHRNQFAIAPTLQIKIGYNESPCVHPFIGYDFIYLTNILKPGEIIDRNVNTTQNILLGGTGVLNDAVAPVAKWHNSNIWLQGISLGVEIDI